MLAGIVAFTVLAYLGAYTYNWTSDLLWLSQEKRDMAWLDECEGLPLPRIWGSGTAHLPSPYPVIFLGTNGVPLLFHDRQYFPLTAPLVPKVTEEIKERYRNMYMPENPSVVIIAHPSVLFAQTRPIYEYANAYRLWPIFIGRNQVYEHTSGGMLIEELTQRDYDEKLIKIHEEFVEFNEENLVYLNHVDWKSRDMDKVVLRVEFSPDCSVQRVLSVLESLPLDAYFFIQF